MIDNYTPIRPNLAHQERIFQRFKDAPYFALFCEQRTGKTKIVLDVFARHVLRGYLDTLIVIAFPNGVHRVFLDELPKDLPSDFLAQTKAIAWRSGKMGTKAAKALLSEQITHDGPVIFTINCEAIKRADSAWDHIVRLVKRRRCMVVADESSWAMSWTGQTERLLTLGGFYAAKPNVLVKAILDGTPCDESPSDLFYPCQFLRKGPALLGVSTMATFKARYFAYETEEKRDDETGEIEIVRKQGYNRRTNTTYDLHVGYQNLDELHGKLASFSERVLRRDVSDAPEKLYSTRYFQLTPKQRQVYDRLREEYVAELSHGDVAVPNVLTRMLRLQMVARNYYPPEKIGVVCPRCVGRLTDPSGDECPRCEGIGIIVETTELARIDDRSPALDALERELHGSTGPVVVWCRFRQDVSDCLELFHRMGKQAGRFDGTVKEAEREEAYQAFRVGRLDHIVSTVGSGLTRGRDLTRADDLIYYSNDFSRRKRSQSEDRAEALARSRSTGIVDLVAEDTRDADVIEALRQKRDIAASILGDGPGRWL